MTRRDRLRAASKELGAPASHKAHVIARLPQTKQHAQRMSISRRLTGVRLHCHVRPCINSLHLG